MSPHGTPRRSAPPQAQGAAVIRGERGSEGKTGPQGEPGRDSPLIEISESGSSLLMGVQPHGFARTQSDAPIQCAFVDWAPSDILQVDFFVALAVAPSAPGTLRFQAQVSFDSGSTWQAVRGASVSIGIGGYSASASASVVLESRPVVRLHAAPYGLLPECKLNYGDGPEASSIVLRCSRTRAGTYAPSGALIPPRP